MTRNDTILKVFLLVALAAIPTSTFAAVVEGMCRSSAGGYCINLAAEIFPGLKFLGEATGLGDLIARLYIWGLGFVGIAAMLMFIYGGVKYMVAGDKDPSDARKAMTNAVIGLVVALLSWLILFTINPDLVQRLNLNLPQLSFKGPIFRPVGDPRCGAGVCPVDFDCISTPSGPTCKSRFTTKPCSFTQCPPNYACVDTPFGASCKPPPIKTGDSCGTGSCSPTQICVDRTSAPGGKACAPLCNVLPGSQRSCTLNASGDQAGCRCPGDTAPKDCGLERIWICTN